MNRKVLIITYYWPPSGGAGVQRWVKFAKYLPENGWEPVILTVDPAFAAYPVTDYSLSAEIPGSLEVYKTPARDYFSIYNKDRSKIPSAGFAKNQDNSLRGKMFRFIRGNFFIPDPRKGWNNYAFRKACELIRTSGITHVITTSPPHSTQLIGLKLKKTFPGITWIADLRDPWTDIYYYDQFYPTKVSRKIDERYERNVLKNADRIIVVGEKLRQAFSGKIKGAEKKIHVITNGYDEKDFEGDSPALPVTFTITYVGTLSDVYPVGGLLEALNRLRTEGIALKLRFIGMVSSRQKNLISSQLEADCEFIPYVNHNDSIKYMRESSALLLIIPDHAKNSSVITGKIFEYIATGRPVICLGPVDGDAAAIISETAHGKTFSYNDSGSIRDYLNYLYGQKLITMPPVSSYSRKELTKKLLKILQ